MPRPAAWSRLAFTLCALLLAACTSAPPAQQPTTTAPGPQATSGPGGAPGPSAAASLAASSAPGATATVALSGPQVPTTDPAVQVFLWGNPGTTLRDLTLAKNGGFNWVKQRFEWRNIEGKGKGDFEWNEPDRIVDAIEQSGLKIIARVDNQPQWAASSVQWPGNGPPDKLSDWTDYLTALASRYKGRIQAYEIWNEPNLDREWGNTTPNPAAYTALLKASYQAIKAADPQALVISAGLSPTTENNAHAMPDMDYFRGMYAAGALGSYDILGVNAPGYKAPPCADPAEVAADPALTNNDPSPTNLKRIYAFRHVEDVRELMVQQGDGGKQMSIMEMGYTTDQVHPDYAWFAVDRQQQATDLVEAFQCARQRWQPWMGIMTVIYIGDPTWTQQTEQYWWSITNPDGSPRPAYTALKNYFSSAS